MEKCFVIQPFDKGRFDKRYEDVFVPAIKDAGLESYRVDRDPGVVIPIENIQSGIESSVACLADISTDNPNIWFELGYAIAAKREVVLVCSDERGPHFPFDIQHRSIIKYSTESTSDFAKLQSQITLKLKTLLTKKQQLGQLAKVQSIAKVEGLEQYEIATLVSIAQQLNKLDDGISTHFVRQDMENSGFTKLAATLGLKLLSDKKMILSQEETDYDGSNYVVYKLTDVGMSWLISNQDKLTLKQKPPVAKKDDIPF